MYPWSSPQSPSLAQVLDCFDELQVQAVHASASSANDFRDSVRAATSKSTSFAMVNFYRPSLQQAGGGHFSPIAAYDAGSDSVLVMDVARYKVCGGGEFAWLAELIVRPREQYPAFWIPLSQLFAALNTTDTSANKSRGWIQITRISDV